MLSLIIGIASSLVATAIFIAASEITRKILLPWYADKIYRGVRIDGHWKLLEIENKPITDSEIGMFLDLHQKGEVVEGTYSHKGLDGTVDIYSLIGCVRDRYFVATATPASNRHVDAAAFLFYVHEKNGALVLTGSILHCVNHGDVGSWGPICFSWSKP